MHPDLAAVINRVLAMPAIRYGKRLISYLNAAEADALIDAPSGTAEGRRDHALLTLTLQTGLRVSEFVALNCGDIVLDTGAPARCEEGKGTQQRAIPLTQNLRPAHCGTRR